MRRVFRRIREFVARRRAASQRRGASENYVSADLVRRLASSGELPELGPREAELSMFFADMTGYVGIAEQLPPLRLVELMNRYFEACGRALDQEDGTIDKFVGDVVVAMFGAPAPLPDHAFHACAAALRTQAALTELRARLASEEPAWPEIARRFRVRIGLNTGHALVGNLGSRSRFNYTMTGDEVNLAARLADLAKSYGAAIVCTEATWCAAEAAGPGRILFRPLGRVVVMGRTAQVALFEPLAWRSEATPRMRACVAAYQSGLERLQARDAATAAAHFRRSAELEDTAGAPCENATNNPSRFYLRIAEAQQGNPAEKWWG